VGHVKRQFLLLTAIAICAFPAIGLSQAAAESAIVTGGAASAATQAGSSLGSALNQAMQQLGEHVTEAVSNPNGQGRQVTRRSGEVPYRDRLPLNRPGTQNPANGTGSDLAARQAAGSPPCAASGAAGTAGSKTNTPCKPKTQYPSAITLSFPKH
jgi:hypothetical protein